MRYTRDENRFHHFFRIFLPCYLERVGLFCNFVQRKTKPKSLTAQTHPHPLTAPTAPHSLSPTLPRREGEKHLKSAVTLKLSPQNSTFKIQPSQSPYR